MPTLALQQKPVANAAPRTAPQLRAVAREEVSENDGRSLARGGTNQAATPPRSGDGPSAFGHSIAQLPSLSSAPLSIQPKLKINRPGDKYEQEADRVADMVMRMPEPTVQRKCSCGGGGCAKCKGGHGEGEHELLQMKRVDANSLGPDEAPASVHEVLRESGRPLDYATRVFMEPRLGHDLGRVRVHNNERAVQVSQELNAQAFTVGHNIVFGGGGYTTGSSASRRLLAHELTHVVQQTGGRANSLPKGGGRISEQTNTPMIARFSDTQHHVVEEAALAAGFTPAQARGVAQGNIHRDYSQVGVVGSLALLCAPSSFGGYKPQEHFDNFIWEGERWRSRGRGPFGDVGFDAGPTPIEYIGAELTSVAGNGTRLEDVTRQGPITDEGLEHLGNAFHTVEDFFAHSNFVELVQGDPRHGRRLMTGDPSGPSQSVPRILEAITPPGISEHYRDQSEAVISAAAPGTHTAMAHDDPTTHNFGIARRYAALVIQDLGSAVLNIMRSPQPQRSRLMQEEVMSRVVRYLRPPDPNDKWWEALASADNGAIDRRLGEAARRTPITVNQCALSPLKNLEASRDSLMALPIGIAIPTMIGGSQVWFQIGAGFTRPIPFEARSGRPSNDGGGGMPIVGAQVVGRF